MSKKRRQHNPEFKAKVGLEALKGIEPVHAIAAKHEVHPVQVSQWTKEVQERTAPSARAFRGLKELIEADKEGLGKVEIEADYREGRKGIDISSTGWIEAETLLTVVRGKATLLEDVWKTFFGERDSKAK